MQEVAQEETVPQPNNEDRVDLIQGLTEKQINCLLRGLIPRMVAKGQAFIREGDTTDSMFLLLEGFVSVVSHADTPAPVMVARRGAGQLFGEVNFVRGGLRSASVIAEGDVLVLEFTKAHIQPLMDTDHEFGMKLALNLARIMAERLSNTTTQLWDAQSTQDLTMGAFKRLQAAKSR